MQSELNTPSLPSPMSPELDDALTDLFEYPLMSGTLTDAAPSEMVTTPTVTQSNISDGAAGTTATVTTESLVPTATCSNVGPATAALWPSELDELLAWTFAAEWLPPPDVSTHDLHLILLKMESIAPETIASVIASRYQLSPESGLMLRRRLSAMVYERRMAQREIRDILSRLCNGVMDGNSALTAIAAWAARDERPPARPFE